MREVEANQRSFLFRRFKSPLRQKKIGVASLYYNTDPDHAQNYTLSDYFKSTQFDKITFLNKMSFVL